MNDIGVFRILLAHELWCDVNDRFFSTTLALLKLHIHAHVCQSSNTLLLRIEYSLCSSTSMSIFCFDSRTDLNFTRTMQLRNPWNMNKPVKIARDGQVSLCLVALPDSIQKFEELGVPLTLQNYNTINPANLAEIFYKDFLKKIFRTYFS